MEVVGGKVRICSALNNTNYNFYWQQGSMERVRKGFFRATM
jgi:hypothetical protein